MASEDLKEAWKEFGRRVHKNMKSEGRGEVVPAYPPVAMALSEIFTSIHDTFIESVLKDPVAREALNTLQKNLRSEDGLELHEVVASSQVFLVVLVAARVDVLLKPNALSIVYKALEANVRADTTKRFSTKEVVKMANQALQAQEKGQEFPP